MMNPKTNFHGEEILPQIIQRVKLRGFIGVFR